MKNMVGNSFVGLVEVEEGSETSAFYLRNLNDIEAGIRTTRTKKKTLYCKYTIA